MFYKNVDGKMVGYVCVPRKYVRAKIKEVDPRLSENFFLLYCIIDKWRTDYKQISYYKTTILNLLEDIGKTFDVQKKKPLTRTATDIMRNLEYMESEGLIRLIRGDYHNPWLQFEIEVIKGKFTDASYVPLNDAYIKYIMEYPSSVNKGYLLHVLLYSLSCYFYNNIYDRNEFVQVYAESNWQTAQKIGISDKTIGLCLKILSDESMNNRPLVMYSPNPIVDKNTQKCKKFPNIYTENTPGYEERIQLEYNYLL